MNSRLHRADPRAKDHGSIAGQGRASQQKRPAHVRFGSIATDRHAGAARGMSALPPIATGLMRHSEASLSAISRHMQRSKTKCAVVRLLR